MYKMNKLVSVIIPSYNREKTIVRAIKSVLSQTYQNIEVIVVDDCSQDNTETVINECYANDKRVVFHRLEKNSGACVARNRGVELSRGTYVAFLDSDDAFFPEKIEKQISYLECMNASLCATDYIRYSREGNEEIVRTFSGTKDTVYEALLYCNYITTGTLLGYRECFIKEPFDEKLPRYQDWDLVLRLCKRFDFCFLQENTLLQYYQPISITASTCHTKTLKALDIIYKKNEEGYRTCKKAYTQIHWLMGIHGMYVEGEKRYKDLLIGATKDGINVKRLTISFLSLFGIARFFEKHI